MCKLNYVIAAWTGPRRNDRHPDGSFYLRTHLEVLARLEHNLAQVTVVIPDNPNQQEGVDAFIDSLHGSRLGGAQVVVLRRENVGLSYGSFALAYQTFLGVFDYYLFVEDDYVFVRDSFDHTLVNLFRRIPNCGYLCGLTQEHNGKPFAGISNGLTSKEILGHVYEHHGKIPFGPNAQEEYSSVSQIVFTTAISDLGYRIADTTDHFLTPYFDSRDRTIREFAPRRSEYLIVPTQMAACRTDRPDDTDWREVLSR